MTPPAEPPLAFSLWDFSWYTQAGPGEPYADLGAALDQTCARGFTALRICAAPLLLYGGLGLDGLAHDLPIEGMGRSPAGGWFGEGTRWYNARGGYSVDLEARLFDLLEGARRRGLRVALSSWEYQQSTAFAADAAWFRAIAAFPPAGRPAALAAAWDHLLGAVHEAGLDRVVALVELHNELDFSWLPPADAATSGLLQGLAAAHPGPWFALSYGQVWRHLDTLPAGLPAGQFHVYAYGVLDALERATDIRGTGTSAFPNACLRSLQRPDAPAFADYGRPAPWKLEATVVTDQMLYGYDTIDPARWDAWLDRHYPAHAAAMSADVAERVTAAAAWGRARGVPVVLGEGWVGYTPLHAGFEDGPAGLALAEQGLRLARRLGLRGATPTSNAAPHHPLWDNTEWLARVNAEFLGG